MTLEVTLRNLIIIGNGFDLHHKMHTKYIDYREYLRKDSLCRSILERYDEKSDPFWSDIENGLKIDCKEFVEEYITAFNFKDVNPGEQIHQDQKAVDRINELRKVYREYIQLTGVEFYQWLYDTYYSVIGKMKKDEGLFDNRDENWFINFNYTLTLEDLYNIEKKSILHIHGLLNKNIKSQLICGGNIKERREELARSEIQFGCIENNPELINEMNILKDIKSQNSTFDVDRLKTDLQYYLKSSYKNIEKNYMKLEKYIESCGKIDQIIVMGNNIFGADFGYYEKILIPKYNAIKWILYCHDDNFETADRLRDEYNLNVEIRKW